MIKTKCFVIGFLIGCVSACDKTNNDFYNPTLTFISPVENAVYNVGDSIPVILDVVSDRKVETLSVTLIDENKTPLSSSHTIEPMKHNFRLEFPYFIDNPLLESGTYKLRARAWAGDEVGRLAIDIIVNEVPKALDNVIVISKGSRRFFKVFEVNNKPDKNLLFEIHSDYAGTGINPAYDILYFAAERYGDMEAIDLETGEIYWHVEGVEDMQFPYFTGLESYGDEVYVCFYEGYIRSYDRFGNVVFNTLKIEEAYPVKVFLHDKFVIAQTNHYLGSGIDIRTFYKVSGEQELKQEINRQLIAVFPRDNESVYLLSTDDSGSYIDEFRLYTNQLINLKTFEATRFSAATAIDEDNFIIATDERVYLYRASVNSSTPFIENHGIYQIRYEPLSQELYALDDKQLMIYSADQGFLLNDITFADTLVNFHFNYNK